VSNDRHGTRSAYNGGCRCCACTEANTAWIRSWRDKRRASGHWRLLNGYWVRGRPLRGRVSDGDGVAQALDADEDSRKGDDRGDERESNLDHAQQSWTEVELPLGHEGI
jgi:hypothetical protein